MITAEVLRSLNPKLDATTAATTAQSLQKAADKFGINTRLRVAHFLAQVAHESGFQAKAENLSYSKERLVQVWPKRFTSIEAAAPYERNPEKLANYVYATVNGNSQPGDGFAYRGRGFIQLTGRGNYARYGKMVGVDVVSAPDLAMKVEVSALLAAAYWDAAGCNKAADLGESQDAVVKVTKLVNGGTVGLEDRLTKFQKCLQTLH
ncbi:MAG TPA: glycoside hydrolase family 19 protein [Myxococcaceae bacterium]|nr:glycoside hydrolase family 19 protein [Myxococcaceae bacterium]